ncbi:ArsR family transcriptional regulator [Natrarchaeobius halalkaliphilus]|uniref:ArsR family transcriptional regulator n=1 Tax=Natrarchaeobius halalkaliphilus TaxID=1679091 RepID=A0A3N6MCT6_9EURY|nr:helix-turn-helix domain-containing protein [Natrarchaeobius halalkaliphilus]RQG93321.1 ArsR family transcriptional regulator [Natrarchaeobius halalkaliphilus]
MGVKEPANAVFGLLSDETRVEILRAIAVAESEHENADPSPAELSFSEIYERINVDNTSKLSYHLGELTETFLRKSDDGYSFTHAGEQIVRFLLSGNYEKPADFDPQPTSGTCLYCGETTLIAQLHHQYFQIECASCERPVSAFPITPAQARSWTDNDLVDNVKQKQAIDYEQIRRGTCPECAGRLSTEVARLPESQRTETIRHLVVDRCRECLRRYNSPLTYRVAYHPASVAFHWDRGIDITSKGLWELHGHVYEGRWVSERISTDPDEYEIVLRYDGDILRIRLDSYATITHTERARSRDVADQE